MKRVIAFVVVLLFSVLLLPITVSAAGGSYDSGSAPAKSVTTVIVLVLVALLIATVICLIWRSQMKTARIARTASNYIPQGGFRLTGQGDMFMYRTVTRRKIQSSSSSGGRPGGGGRGGSSGRIGKF